MNDISSRRATDAERVLQSAAPGGLVRAELVEISESGLLIVQCGDGSRYACEVLQPLQSGPPLATNDRLLVLSPVGAEPGVVLGRIGRYLAPRCASQVTIEASDSLTLKCGEASIDLRADGKVMVRGEDVLLRAKGTQRIRAGTVSIN